MYQSLPESVSFAPLVAVPQLYQLTIESPLQEPLAIKHLQEIRNMEVPALKFKPFSPAMFLGWCS